MVRWLLLMLFRIRYPRDAGGRIMVGLTLLVLVLIVIVVVGGFFVWFTTMAGGFFVHR